MWLRSRSLKHAVLATYIARGWSVAMGLAFIPVYMRAMGAEAFGLVGLFVMLQAVFFLLDVGLGSKLNHDFARLIASSSPGQKFRDLLWTLEIPLWTAAILGGAVILGVGPIVAARWLNVEALSSRTLSLSVRLMGLILLFQLPMAFYAGGLLGLQRQVLYSALNATWYTLRFVGGAIVVLFVAPTPEAFFTWQLIVAVVITTSTRLVLRHCLPPGECWPRWSWSLLVSHWEFTTGLGAISLTALVLNQADKLILSRLLPLKEFGYYTLAWSVAYGLKALSEPMFSALFPRLSYLVATGDSRQLSRTYHATCQLVTVIVVPIGGFLTIFAPEIMVLWTRDPFAASQTRLLTEILALGNTLFGLVVVPSALQLAHGWTSLNLGANIASIAIFAPLLAVLTPWYGAAAAAWLWLLLNAGYVCVMIPVMHRRLLRGELWRWYVNDVGMSAIAATLVLGLARIMLSARLTPIATACVLGGSLLAALLSAVLASPLFWTWSQVCVHGGQRREIIGPWVRQNEYQPHQ